MLNLIAQTCLQNLNCFLKVWCWILSGFLLAGLVEEFAPREWFTKKLGGEDKWIKKYFHQLITGISFGLTTAVITSLGMIVGIYSATSSKLAVVTGIIIMAIADGLSDAMGLHLAEESETEKGRAKHTQKEIWLTTLFTFLSVFGFSLTFAIPILLFPLKTAVFLAIGWGIMLLILLNFYIAKIRKENPIKLISEHVLLALFVVIISNWVGNLMGMLF